VIRPQFNATSNGTTGWVHGTRVMTRESWPLGGHTPGGYLGVKRASVDEYDQLPVRRPIGQSESTRLVLVFVGHLFLPSRGQFFLDGRSVRVCWVNCQCIERQIAPVTFAQWYRTCTATTRFRHCPGKSLGLSFQTNLHKQQRRSQCRTRSKSRKGRRFRTERD
jgi:hypothetical protein